MSENMHQRRQAVYAMMADTNYKPFKTAQDDGDFFCVDCGACAGEPYYFADSFNAYCEHHHRERWEDLRGTEND